MDIIELDTGFADLNDLAKAEFRLTLPEITASGNRIDAADRVGRLVGVMIKQPFAMPETLNRPSPGSRAYRAWNLVGIEAFRKPGIDGSWQYKTLQQIGAELEEGRAPEDVDVYGLCEYAHRESTFFSFFATTVRKYICRDERIRKRVEDAVKEASGGSDSVPLVTPERIVGAGGLALGAYLVQTIPILGMVGAPVIAGLLVILYTLGVDTFCEWSDSNEVTER